jgi:hypothetical protein
MVGLSATGAVNTLIVTNPEEALAIAAGLAAVGGSLTLRHCFRTIGLNKLNRDENLEVDLLDAEAPEGFWQRAVSGVYAGLVAQKMTEGTITPRFRWFKGLWTVDHGLNVGSEIEPVRLVDLTTVETPILKGDHLA